MRMRAGRSGKADQILFDDDAFDDLEAILVEGKDAVADELILLQPLDDFAIVAVRPAALLGDLRGDGLHLGLIFGESFVSHLREFGGRDVDAESLPDSAHTAPAAGGNRCALSAGSSLLTQSS